MFLVITEMVPYTSLRKITQKQTKQNQGIFSATNQF